MGKLTDALSKGGEEPRELSREAPGSTRSRVRLNVDPHIVAYEGSKSTVIEQYRVLRTNLQSLNSDKPCRSFLVTSAVSLEGKSTTVLNLGLVFSKDLGRPVLVVDADLHRPSVLNLLGLEPRPGLAEVLAGEVRLEDALVTTDVPHFHVLGGGRAPANPSALVSSQRMAEVLDRLTHQYDYLFFDAPPVLSVSDASVIGSKVDGVLLVVKAGSTKRDVVARAQALLRSAKAGLVGVVLTQIEEYLPYYIYKYEYTDGGGRRRVRRRRSGLPGPS